MCRSLGVWVRLFLIKLIEASEQNMSQSADKHTNEPEKTSQIWCVSHRKALIALFPHLQDCLLLFLLIRSHISMIKTEKLAGGPHGSTLLMHSCSTSDSEEEEKPASSQEDRTKDSQRINKVWKELQSGGVWNRRLPKRPGGWVGSVDLLIDHQRREKRKVEEMLQSQRWLPQTETTTHLTDTLQWNNWSDTLWSRL